MESVDICINVIRDVIFIRMYRYHIDVDVGSKKICCDNKEIVRNELEELVLTRNLPEYKKFIGDYLKEIIVYKDHVEVKFNKVFYFTSNEINYDLSILNEKLTFYRFNNIIIVK